jgi:hypothetical protein
MIPAILDEGGLGLVYYIIGEEFVIGKCIM